MTQFYQISTPFPSYYLEAELQTMFPLQIVTRFPDETGLESCLMFNLTDSEISIIQKNFGDCLISLFVEGGKVEL